MKKVLCIADSVALPRDGVSYDDTWIRLVKEKYAQIFDIIPLVKRGLTTNALQDINEYFLYYSPNVVILQLGIVDCAPRYIRENSILDKIIAKLPGSLQTLFWKFWKFFFKRSVKFADVPIGQFKQNLENYISLCVEHNVAKVIIVQICKPGQQMVRSNPTIIEVAESYNQIYKDLASTNTIITLLDPLSTGEDKHYIDGYHCNASGNFLVFKSLDEALSLLQ